MSQQQREICSTSLSMVKDEKRLRKTRLVILIMNDNFVNLDASNGDASSCPSRGEGTR